MDIFPWKDSVAIVTGASSGIGREVARMLLARGMKVAAVGRRREELMAIGAEAKCPAGRFDALVADVRKTADIDRLFLAARSSLGPVSVVINSAGLSRNAPLTAAETSADDWRDMFEVNVMALCYLTKLALADMEAAGRGHVIHVSSLSGHRQPVVSSGHGHGFYAATKYAVRAITEACRLELRAKGSNVRVSSVSPGLVNTEFFAQYYASKQKSDEFFAKTTTLQPEDVARAIVHVLAQPDGVEIHDLLIRSTGQRD